jgi:hypothetical protein
MTGNVTISVATGHINLSPVAFHLWATHYYKCCHDFQCLDRFSPVPYFLLCRAIELELKSRHLETKGRNTVKNAFGHHLTKAYSALPPDERILSPDELEVLHPASDIYASKGFEYVEVKDSVTGYTRFPELSSLDSVTKKLLRM